MKLFSLLFLLSSYSIIAQVGIGTTTPATTLDIVAANPSGTGTSVDGILIPRVTRQRAQSMTGTTTSTIIYVNEVATGSASGTTINVTTVGFYFYNGTVWEKLASGTTTDWSLIGNTGTVPATNFLGTTDDNDLVFRRNNIRAGFIGDPIYNLSTFNSNNGNTSFGANSLLSPTINVGSQFGVRNTAFGANVMPGLTTGQRNTAIGDLSLFSNTSGSENIAIGSGALFSNTISSGHVAVGRNALTSYNGPATADIGNTAIGFTSLRDNVTGTGNSTLGYRALRASTGSNNTAIGFDAGLTLTTGSNNIMIGANTVAPVVAGSDQLNIGNTLFGTMAGALTSGVNTTRTLGVNVLAPQAALDIVSTNNGLLIPRVSLLAGGNFSTPVATISDSEIIYNTNTVGSGINAVTPGFYHWNTATARWVRFNTGAATGWLTTGNSGLTAGTNFIGTTDAIDVSFKRNNTAAGFIGANSTAFGVSSLASNTGSNNTAFGTSALAANDTPSNNTAIGFNSLSINTNNAGGGNQNTAIGSGALATLNGGIANTAVGFNALNAAATLSQFNTAVGAGALSGVNNAASRDNVAVGYNAMTQPGVITNSVAIGSNALFSAANTSTRNTAIGFSAGSNITTGTDNIVIGANAQVPSSTGTNQVQMGGATIGYAGIQVGWTITSDKRWKNTIKDSELGLDFIKTLRPVSYIRNNDSKHKTEYGFIAQELEEAFKKVGDSNNAVITKSDDGMFGVRYNDFISISVKAIQEQQVQIDALKKANDDLLKENAAILDRLEKLEKKFSNSTK